MKTKKIYQLYKPFQNMKFDNEHCFLCGTKLHNTQQSQEHIFPKWLQHKYNLWNQTLTLQNGTTIPYRQLAIPCCRSCNGKHLSKVENKIKGAVELGYDEFIRLDEKVIFQWIGKIYYGILFKEISLIDFKTKNRESIMNQERLGRYKMLHECLQSIRVPIQFDGFFPWSIFVVKMHNVDHIYDFDFIDTLHLTVAFKLGDIGIIASLGDNGALKNRLKEKFDQFQGIPLFYTQFLELVSQMNYNSILIRKAPVHMLVTGENVYRILGMPNSSAFNEFNHFEYSRVLGGYLKKKIGSVPKNLYNKEKDRAVTFLTNNDGNIQVLNNDGSVNNQYYLDKYGELPSHLVSI